MMVPYRERSDEELLSLLKGLNAEYEGYKAKKLNLNMARGKPSKEQLALSMGMMDVLGSQSDMCGEDGTDCRNYGVLDGIPEAKRLLGDMVGAPASAVIVCGNSSLNVMYDTVSHAYTHGVMGSTPWCRLPAVKFLCPAPGYDRHFGITEFFGIEMIPVEMTPEGPDIETVERLVREDEAIKGIWCVPKYSNPQGYTYAPETVRRMAALKPKAADFRIYWDNAYAIHHLYDEGDSLLDILEECRRAGSPDMVYEFVSTSKISFPGSGIASVISSERNLEDIRKQMSRQTIGYDKLNQLRHVRFFGDIEGVKEHMKKHAAILRPKFEAVLNTLEKELGGKEIGSWTKPRGGYFISFDGLEGTAAATVRLCREAGVVMTGAGATYPYGVDPRDRNIRIAPSYPTLEELKTAAALFALCVKKASVEKILDERGKG